LSPFSSSVTLDENRSLLPPAVERPPIYTYYDYKTSKNQELKDAESALLLTWRRAWWAQGFKPVILSPAEAMNNPLYTELQVKDLELSLKTELSRWLAWENMGTGILCSYLTFPMGGPEDPLLSYLLRGKYPVLTRFESLGSALFSGSKAEITAAVRQALDNPDLKSKKDFISAVSPKTFTVDPKHDSLALYTDVVIREKYSQIAEYILEKGGQGMHTLTCLISAHLHGNWQNLFPKGIAVLKPDPVHMTSLIEPAVKLAEFLSRCPETPLPSSCPPNRPKCKPCLASQPLIISTPPAYRNTSGLYTIGTVPHPYTMALLSSFRDEIDVPWIRRDSSRDPWLSILTKELLGTGISGAPRVIKFKEAVASQHEVSHSLWVTAERDLPTDLEWYFGFNIPQNATDGKSEAPVPGPERRPRPVHDSMDGPLPPLLQDPPDILAAEKETRLLMKAKEFGKARMPEEEILRGAIEAWNLADTEAWRFARAFMARSRVERLKWEQEEAQYAGGAGAERGKSEGWGRWFDD
jgi:hypothetical protein